MKNRSTLATMSVFMVVATLWGGLTPATCSGTVDCGTSLKPVRTLCLMPHKDILSAATHAAHTTSFYAAEYPCITWKYRFLTTNDDSAKNFVRTWAVDSTNCSFLVGPGFSYLAVAMSPLVAGIPWLDPTATSTELTNKARHPAFSRVIPTDNVGAEAAAVVFRKFGWKDTHTICADEPYGRSVSSSLANEIRKAGGAVGESFAIDPDSNETKAVADALQHILDSNIRVVFVAALPFQEFWRVLRDEILRTRAYEKLIFFFSEAMCSLTDRAYNLIPGAFCATYSADPDIMEPFLASYKLRNVTADQGALNHLGFSPTQDDLANVTDLYAALAHDAALHGMHTLHQHHINETAAALEPEILTREVVTLNGASGSITLNSDGDRSIIAGTLWHTVDNQTTEARLATLTIPGTWYSVQYLDRNGVNVAEDQRQDMLVLGNIVTASDSIPASTVSDPAPAKSNLALLVGTVIGATVLLALSSIFMAVILRPKDEGRDETNAPTDMDSPFTIAFTDIQSSTSLWAREPMIMSEAVELHHKAIRKLIHKHQGYEVKTLGDSFMVAFKSPRSASRFAIDVQVKLKALNWEDDQIIEDTYQEIFIEEGRDIAPQSGRLWEGLRVRVGVHEGFGQIKYDEVSQGYDYFGTAVNTAARLEAVGHGGQIVVTQETLTGICQDSTTMEGRWATPLPSVETGRAIEMEGFIVSPLGSHVLRGLEHASTLYQLSPKGPLLNRKWPPLRTDAPSIQTDFEHEDPFTPMDSVTALTMPQSDLNMLLYKHCKKRLMRWHEGWSMEHIESYADRLMETQLLLKTLLSAGKDKFRRQTVTTLAQKWHLVYKVTEGRLTAPRTYETALMDLAIKVQNVVDNQCSRERKKIFASTMTEDGALVPPKSTWVTRRASVVDGSSSASPRSASDRDRLSRTSSRHGQYQHDGISLRSAVTPEPVVDTTYLDEKALNQMVVQTQVTTVPPGASHLINNTVHDSVGTVEEMRTNGVLKIGEMKEGSKTY